MAEWQEGIGLADRSNFSSRGLSHAAVERTLIRKLGAAE
jgi:hypothetical protein